MLVLLIMLFIFGRQITNYLLHILKQIADKCKSICKYIGNIWVLCIYIVELNRSGK